MQVNKRLQCVKCGFSHYCYESVYIKRTGLAFGIGCVGDEVRELLGLQHVEEVSLKHFELDPDKQFSDYFTLKVTPRNDSILDEDDYIKYKKVLNAIGLAGLVAYTDNSPPSEFVLNYNYKIYSYNVFVQMPNIYDLAVRMQGLKHGASNTSMGVLNVDIHSLAEFTMNTDGDTFTECDLDRFFEAIDKTKNMEAYSYFHDDNN